MAATFSWGNSHQRSWSNCASQLTWVALWKQGWAGAVFTELQDEESVWAEPVDDGLLS